MKKRLKGLLMVLTVVASFFLGGEVIHASVEEPTVIEGGVAVYLSRGDEAQAYEYIVTWNTKSPGSVSESVIEAYISMGYLTEYIDDFKALGYISDDNCTPAAAPAPTEKAEPEPFTVEAYSPAKTMWATNNVNLRTGASTDYDKAGSLEQYEEVSVTGVASTGWYEITKEDGSKVYVSNNYLTEETPRDRVVYDYDESTDTMYEYNFTDTDPEVIDQIVEQIEAEETIVETTEEVATETVVEEVVEVIDETIEESTEEPTPVETFSENVKRAPYMLVGIGVCIAGAILGIVMAFKKPKRKNRN